jgi:hypothetical protein
MTDARRWTLHDRPSPRNNLRCLSLLEVLFFAVFGKLAFPRPATGMFDLQIRDAQIKSERSEQ